MLGLNRVQLIGNVGKKIFSIGEGERSGSRFYLAVNEANKTVWFTIEAWGEKSELIKKYLRSGRLVYIEGKLVPARWRTREGTFKNEMHIRLQRILFLDTPDNGATEIEEEEDPFAVPEEAD